MSVAVVRGSQVALVLLVLVPAAGSSVRDQLDALGEESLRCTGCEMVADALHASLDSKIARSFKGWNDEERVTNVGKAMRMDGADQTCCRLAHAHPQLPTSTILLML